MGGWGDGGSKAGEAEHEEEAVFFRERPVLRAVSCCGRVSRGVQDLIRGVNVLEDLWGHHSVEE